MPSPLCWRALLCRGVLCLYRISLQLFDPLGKSDSRRGNVKIVPVVEERDSAGCDSHSAVTARCCGGSRQREASPRARSGGARASRPHGAGDGGDLGLSGLEPPGERPGLREDCGVRTSGTAERGQWLCFGANLRSRVCGDIQYSKFLFNRTLNMHVRYLHKHCNSCKGVIKNYLQR